MSQPTLPCRHGNCRVYCIDSQIDLGHFLSTVVNMMILYYNSKPNKCNQYTVTRMLFHTIMFISHSSLKLIVQMMLIFGLLWFFSDNVNYLAACFFRHMKHCFQNEFIVIFIHFFCIISTFIISCFSLAFSVHFYVAFHAA